MHLLGSELYVQRGAFCQDETRSTQRTICHSDTFYTTNPI